MVTGIRGEDVIGIWNGPATRADWQEYAVSDPPPFEPASTHPADSRGRTFVPFGGAGGHEKMQVSAL